MATVIITTLFSFSVDCVSEIPSTVGLEVCSVGVAVGSWVGLIVLGAAVGLTSGGKEGRCVGLLVGFAEGAAVVGAALGRCDGELVGC